MPKWDKLTLKQKKFVDRYIETSNATQAAEDVYNCKNRTTASAIGTENLWKPLIEASIEERLQTCKNIIYWIATKDDEKSEVRIKAAQDVIDRIEWKATQRVESKIGLDWSIKWIKIEIT